MFRSPRFAGDCSRQNAVGRSVSFTCGSYVQFGLHIDPGTKTIADLRYLTNGCGFAMAAAEAIAVKFQQARLTDLHGADLNISAVADLIGEVPHDRFQCLEVAADAFRAALADHRIRTIEEFRGEKALICTCFGISEDSIADLIEINKLTDLADVATACNAGSGCGSCRMLIQEMIDSRESP